MRVRPIFALIAALAAITLVGATGFAASADEVWEQQYQRESSTAACPTPADETPWQASYTGQREWAGSWAQWPNDGQGGWVCQRSIIWAHDPPPGPGCIPWMNGPFGPFYYDFLGSTYLPVGAPVYLDAACSAPSGSNTSVGTAYASDGTGALSICATHGYSVVYDRTNNVWSCG
ncbi:MAG: hypothetical protein WAO50_07555 [Candidatus Nanopelagicales bacterium]